MKFTKTRQICRSLPLVMMLGACSIVSDKSVETTPRHHEGKASIEENSDVINIQHLLDKSNRYLDRKKSVSAAARKNFNHALKTKKSGQLDEAEAAFIKLTVNEPGLSGPWVQLGDIAKERAQHAIKAKQKEQLLKKATAQYHQALSINPHNYYGHNRLALVYRELGQFELALAHYEKAIDSWPAFASAYKNRGILYDLYLGDKNKALDNYRLYQALSKQKATVEQDGAKAPSFVKQQRQIAGWIADLTRQIQQQNQQAQQQTEVANNVL